MLHRRDTMFRRTAQRRLSFACYIIWIASAQLGAASDVLAQRTDELRRELRGVEVVEKHGAQLPNVPFVDQAGRPVMLGAYSETEGRQPRPMILTFNYTDCPMLCSLQLSSLADSIKKMPLKLGQDFDVITIGIDPEETYQTAERARQKYGRLVGDSKAVEAGWHFLIGEDKQIKAAAKSVGFGYKFDPETKQYKHKASLIVLTPEGKVSRYLHGAGYPPKRLQVAIERAGRGEIATSQEQADLPGFSLNCFDFTSQNNASAALWGMRIVGVLTLAGLIGMVLFYRMRDRKQRQKQAE